MQFLDDFIELLDNVPMEVRERYEEMRKLDELNKQALAEYEKKSTEYIAAPKNSKQKEQVKKHLDEMIKEIRERGKQKIVMADRMFDMMTKYEDRLTKESMLYKYELEADNPGITEQIESKFTQTVRSYKPLKGEKKKRGRKPGSVNRATAAALALNALNAAIVENGNSNGGISLDFLTNGNGHVKKENGNDENSLKRKAISPGMTMASIRANSRDRSQSRSRGSRASTPASKAGAPIVNGIGNPAASSLLMNASESRHGRPRKLTSRAQEMIINRLENRVGRPPGSVNNRPEHPGMTGPSESMKMDVDGVGGGVGGGNGDEAEDNDHRPWCICNEKSYGEMVACDGKLCPYEWFHYHCVNISEPPKGTWLCPHCRKQQAALANALCESESTASPVVAPKLNGQ